MPPGLRTEEVLPESFRARRGLRRASRPLPRRHTRIDYRGWRERRRRTIGNWIPRPASGGFTATTAASHRPAAKIVVVYAAGYRLPGDPQRDLPEDLERVCLETVKARWFARLRDPLVKGEQVQGIASADYWVPSTRAGDPGLPPSVVGLLQRYRLPTV